MNLFHLQAAFDKWRMWNFPYARKVRMSWAAYQAGYELGRQDLTAELAHAAQQANPERAA